MTGVQQIEIKKKPVTDVTFPITNEVIYGASLCDIPTTGMQDDYGTFTWMDPTYVPSVDDAKSPMCYEPSDKKNYDYREVQGYDSKSGNIVRDVVLSVRRKKGELPHISAGFLAEGDELEKSEIVPDNLELGDFYWAKPEEKVTQSKSEYTLIFRPKDLRNYDWSEWSQNELDWNRFQIQQKVDVVPYPEPMEIVYGDTLGSKSFMGKNPDVKYRWQDEAATPQETGLQKLMILYRNQEIMREMEVVVLKRKPDYVIPVLEAVSYHPEQRLKDIKLPEHWCWTEPECVPRAGTAYYEAYYEPEDTEHYQTVYEKIPLHVQEAAVVPKPAITPGETPSPQPTKVPGETSEPQPTITPDVGVKPEATAVPSQVPGDNGTEAEKTSAAVQQQIKKSSPEINKAAVISTEGADRPGKKLTLFGVKTQKQKPGKVRFKKTGYRGGKIRLVWGKSKNAKGYQIVFMKRKKGKMRMVKYTKRTKLSLTWNGVGKCYVKIRAFQIQGKKRTYGSWSVCKRVKSH